MIRKPEEAPASLKVISLALNITDTEAADALSSLQGKQIITKRPKTNSYIFKNNVGVDLEKEIREVMAKQPEKWDLAEKIQEISELDYILPKKHNQDYTITRYFEYIFMTEEQFLNLPDAEYLFKDHFADGKIITLIQMKPFNLEAINAKEQMLNDKRLILLFPEKQFQEEKTLRRLEAVKTHLADDEFTENNQILIQELQMYQEDLSYELNQYLKKTYAPDEGNCRVKNAGQDFLHGFQQGITFNGFISKICNEVYGKTPRINNELINRQNISAQNRNARDKILTMLLDEKDCSELETATSAEATIYRATLNKTGIRNSDKPVEKGCQQVLDEIDLFITECDGQKNSFQKLYEKLSGIGYGARKGIIPIYLVNQLSLLQDTPVIYLNEMEVSLSSDIFENINQKPEDYYLLIEHETAQKEGYLSNLEKLFLDERRKAERTTKGKRLRVLADAMHRWYRSLPQATQNFKKQPEECSETDYKALLAFRKLFQRVEINPRELLFEKIPDLYPETEYEELSNRVISLYQILQEHSRVIEEQAITAIKTEFKAKTKESLKACLLDWYSYQSETAKTYLANNRVTNFMTFLDDLKSNDEVMIANKISKIVIGMHIDDWTDDSLEEFQRAIHDTRNEIEAIKQKNQSKDGRNYIKFTNSEGKEVEKYYDDASEDDSTSYFLKNAIEDALDEFGDSLEMNQKVAVLMKALEKLIQK